MLRLPMTSYSLLYRNYRYHTPSLFSLSMGTLIMPPLCPLPLSMGNCPPDKNLDFLYANVKDAYSSTPLPLLSHSDHNLVHLLPAYVPMVNKQPSTKVCDEVV